MAISQPWNFSLWENMVLIDQCVGNHKVEAYFYSHIGLTQQMKGTILEQRFRHVFIARLTAEMYKNG